MDSTLLIQEQEPAPVLALNLVIRQQPQSTRPPSHGSKMFLIIPDTWALALNIALILSYSPLPHN